MEIRILGELEIVREGRAIPLPASKRTRALLGFLVATQQPHLRERLCELLWEGPNDPRAALRWSLAKLRPIVGDKLTADRERVAIVSGADLHEVKKLDLRTAGVADLRRAAQQFRGELLDGLDLPDCFRYQAWFAAEREAARALRLSLYDALVARLVNEPDEALSWAHTRLSVDPLAEIAHAQVMRSLHRLGRAKEALKHYDDAQRLLEGELGARGGAELERARQECMQAPSVERTATVIVAPKAVVPSARAPLVGRDQPCAEMRRWVAAAVAGAPHGVGFLSGEPGIGKSRLLDEVSAEMRAAGGRVLEGRAFEAELLRPWGAWIDAVRLLDPAELSEEIRRDVGPLLPRPPPETGGDRARLFDGAARMLSQLAPAGRPLLVKLDDVQWLDESSAALLHFVARALESSRVLIVCAARPGELADNRAALHAIRALLRDQHLSRIELGALDAAAVAELAGDVDAAKVFASSGGNPLYALEVASALRAGGLALGDTLDDLLRERLERVEGRARDILPFAAALGHSIGPELLAAATGLPAADLLGAVDALEQSGILRAGAGGGWNFSHDLVRDAAYRSLSEPRRRLLHQQIAQAMLRLPDPDDARAAERAHHATLGGDPEAAARAWLVAAARSTRVFAGAEAEKATQRGFALLDQLPPEARADIELPLYDVLLQARNGVSRREVDAGISRAIVRAEGVGRVDRVQRGFYMLAFTSFRAQDYASALASTHRSADIARSTNPQTEARALAATARCLVLIERDMPRAYQLAHEADAIAKKNQLTMHEVPWALGMVHHYTGELSLAADEHQLALRYNEAKQDHFADCVCMAELAAIELERRRYPEARKWAQKVMQLVARIGEGSEGPFAATIQALAGYGAGEATLRQVEGALAVLRDVDAQALYSYALNTLAELELERGRRPEAAAAARRALSAAEVVDRKSEIALAQAILCEVEGRDVASLQSLADEGAALSARARRRVSTLLRSP